MGRKDDKAARATRARALRERVEKVIRGETPPPGDASPREFIHRQMRELERGKKSRGGDEPPRKR